MQAILSDKKYSYEWSQITEALPLDVMVAMFDTKQALFIDGALNFVRRSFRNMDADFSILPMPKLDEAQDTYYGYSNSAMTYLMVPATIGDPDKVSFILEALCAASGEITDTYYRTCIEGKYVRDAESIDMMNIAAANIVYDMGFLYNWGSLGNSIQNAMMNSGGYASLIASGKEAEVSAGPRLAEAIRAQLAADAAGGVTVVTDESAGKNKSLARCHFYDNKLEITSVSVNGKVRDEISTAHEGGEIEIGFNCRYLTEALKASQCDKLRLSLSSPYISMVIEPLEADENDKFIFLVLPCKLK